MTKLIKFATAYFCESVLSAVLVIKRGKKRNRKTGGAESISSRQRKCDLRNYARINKCKIPKGKMISNLNAHLLI